MSPRIVMFIDDDDFQREFITDMLTDLGVGEVLTANGGKDGLALYDGMAFKPELLLCDLNMPGMDGIEFLREIAERDYAGGIGVLSGMDTGLLKAAEALAYSYGLNLLGALEKPAKREEVQNILSRVGQLRTTEADKPAETSLSYEELLYGLANDQIEVFFQPKVATSDARVIGVECLARWHHPERGMLGPDTFIHVAEQYDYINELTLDVLRKAVQQAAEWQDAGHDFKIAVNLSTCNLNHIRLPEIIHQIVHDAGIDNQQIILEITESGIMDDFYLCLDILTRLRLKGFRLSIDDFGTGYSSMDKLKRLPFSELKVDKAFVTGATGDDTARTMLESSVHLEQALGLNLVAEGVETKEDWDLVAKLGCNEIQGYFVAKPMPGNELIEWKKWWERDMNSDNPFTILKTLSPLSII